MVWETCWTWTKNRIEINNFNIQSERMLLNLNNQSRMAFYPDSGRFIAWNASLFESNFDAVVLVDDMKSPQNIVYVCVVIVQIIFYLLQIYRCCKALRASNEYHYTKSLLLLSSLLLNKHFPSLIRLGFRILRIIVIYSFWWMFSYKFSN